MSSSPRLGLGRLCFRCEYRARGLELGTWPRFECGQCSMSVHSCYLFRPVAPPVLRKAKNDKRMVGYRVESCGLAEGKAMAIPLMKQPVKKAFRWVRVFEAVKVDRERAVVL